MSQALLSISDGMSAWLWPAIAVVFAGLKLRSDSLWPVWLAFAAALTAIVVWIFPELGGLVQFTLFALLTVAFVAVGRTLVGRTGDTDDAGNSKRNPSELVGREVEVISFEFHEGRVTIDGTIWPARITGTRIPKPGDRVSVVAADRVVVWVKPL